MHGSTGRDFVTAHPEIQELARQWAAHPEPLSEAGFRPLYPAQTTYTVAGTTLTSTRVCPAGDPIAATSYSVIGNSIRFTDVGATGAGSSARVLVRQP